MEPTAVVALVVVGILLGVAALLALARRGDREQQPPTGYGLSMGLVMGAGVGVALGTAMGNLALGLPIGATLGMVLGGLYERRRGGADEQPRGPLLVALAIGIVGLVIVVALTVLVAR